MYIQVLLDLSYQHEFITNKKKLLLVLLAMMIGAGTLGWLVANRGLRSLKLLADTTSRINIQSLGQRIDPASWPVELRKTAAAFNHMLSRIEASFERLKQFSGDLAHELRIPLTNLVGESEMALSKPLTVPEYQDVIGSNLEEFQRLSTLIDDMLFLARTENVHQLQVTTMNVNAEIHAIMEFFMAVADEKRISMRCEGDATLQANSALFRRVINNLLSNALKFTPEDGQITFVITEQAKQVIIQIIDTGVGIEATSIPTLFNRFTRAQGHSHQPGHGLGLSIVKSIMDRHNGTVTLSSEAGKGTCVTLAFNH